MRIVLLLFVLLTSVKASPQVLCGTASEGGTVTLTAPVGYVFITVEFASYGTPNGTCGSFTLGSCHSASSGSICSNAFVGHNSATVSATNGIFGDPCGGTFKRLYVQARYDALVPLLLNSFTARKVSPNEIRLDWMSDGEGNISHFVVEKSYDSKTFDDAGLVFASGETSEGYSFTTDIEHSIPEHFFRLRMVDRDGKMKFSTIIRVNSSSTQLKLLAYPNPADKFISVSNNKPQAAVITNVQGMVLKNVLLVNGAQTIDISEFRPGVYFIRSAGAAVKFVKR